MSEAEGEWLAKVEAFTVRLRALERRVDYLVTLTEIGGDKMSQALDNLTAQVTRLRTVTESVVTLVKGLADQIEANKLDPAKLQELADEIRGDVDTIQTAVTTNTPAQPGGAP